jgi:ketosteroid isomerase-like protein
VNRPGSLDELLDRAAIVDLVGSYAHAIDDRDVDGVVACFAADGRMEFAGGEIPPATGHEELRRTFTAAFATPRLAPPATSTHLMSDTLVVLDGDTATVRTRSVAHLASPALGVVVTRGLLYRDEVRRVEDGGWRIAHRVHRSLWETQAPGRVL